MDQRRAANKGFSPEDDVSMLRFLLETESVGGPFALWREFQAKTGNQKSLQCLNNRFKHYLSPNLHLADLELEDKVKLYKKYNIAVEKGFREVVKETLGLQIDNYGYIVQDKVVPSPAARKAPRRQQRQPAISGFTANPRVKRSRRQATPAANPMVLEPATIPLVPQNIAPEVLPNGAFLAQMKTLIAETAKEVVTVSVAEVLADMKSGRVPIPLRNAKTDARNCLQDLKTLVVNLNSQVMKDIEMRIDTALQNCSGEEKISLDSIHGILDVALQMDGF